LQRPETTVLANDRLVTLKMGISALHRAGGGIKLW
jgi:hypothetical protein